MMKVIFKEIKNMIWGSIFAISVALLLVNLFTVIYLAVGQNWVGFTQTVLLFVALSSLAVISAKKQRLINSKIDSTGKTIFYISLCVISDLLAVSLSMVLLMLNLTLFIVSLILTIGQYMPNIWMMLTPILFGIIQIVGTVNLVKFIKKSTSTYRGKIKDNAKKDAEVTQ